MYRGFKGLYLATDTGAIIKPYISSCYIIGISVARLSADQNKRSIEDLKQREVISKSGIQAEPRRSRESTRRYKLGMSRSGGDGPTPDSGERLS